MPKDNTETRCLIISSFWVVILLGLPLWWKTTEVYRAQLPFAEIEEWSNWGVTKLEFPTLFTLHIASTGAYEFQYLLTERLEGSLKTVYANQIAACNSSKATEPEAGDAIPSTSKTIEFPVKVESNLWYNWSESDELPSMPSINGLYDIFIMPDDAKTNKLSLRNNRQAILMIAKDQWNLDTIEKILSRLIPSFFSEEQETIGQFLTEQSSEAKSDPSSMRTLKYSSLYQLTFSLMNGDPSTLLADWEIEEAVATYLKPFVEETSVVSNFTIDSQIQHYATLTFEPQHKESDNNGKDSYFYLSPDSLPHFINSAEWNLASAVSSYPTINFILYVPSWDQSPLLIHDSKGNPTENNAFLIPRWGGIVIDNPVSLNGTHTYTFVELKSILEIFVSQLRGLLGVREFKSDMSPMELQEYSIEIHYAAPPNTAITLWELDRLVRRRVAENIVATVSTLKSLSQLVSEIPNMVVLDHIQTEVLQALESLKKSCTSLRAMQYDIALEHAKQAIIRSERAFFDPTMVSMLYFPDEHKYAIYMPLFVPISVPLLVAVLRELREFRAKRKAEKGEKKKVE